VVHPSGVKPLIYSEAALQGHGLREEDLTKVISRLIQHKLSQREPVKWPLEADDLREQIDTQQP